MAVSIYYYLHILWLAVFLYTIGGINKMYYTTMIIQEYNHKLSKKYKELCNNYIKLKEKAEDLYQDNITNELYKDKLEYGIDDTVIKDTYFQKYVTDKKKGIENLLKNEVYLYEEKISKTFDVRKRMLNRRLENLELDNIGTTLNVLREFYNDIYIDIERNRKSENQIYKDNNIEKYYFNLDESFINNKQINYKFDISIEHGGNHG